MKSIFLAALATLTLAPVVEAQSVDKCQSHINQIISQYPLMTSLYDNGDANLMNSLQYNKLAMNTAASQAGVRRDCVDGNAALDRATKSQEWLSMQKAYLRWMKRHGSL